MTAVLGCIADDFTGGTDLAETLSRNGMRTIQLLGVPDTALASEAAAQADALVVALKIRTVPVEEAVSQALAALEALRAAGCRQFFWKYCSTFDSTPKGNIGPVAEGLLQALGGDRAVAAEGLEQALRHRADVALGGGVEGGAVFPEELAAARGAQGFERGEGLADGLLDGDGADLQGHDQRVGLCGGFRGQRGIRHTQKLDGAHPVAAQGFGKVGAAGEIVGDAAKNGSHGIRLLWGEEVRRPAQESGRARAGPAASGRGGRWLPAPPPRPAPWSGLRRR